MKVEISAGKIHGKVNAPPSKSMAHRALICAFLSGQKCSIENISCSDDINATACALETLGAIITKNPNSITINGSNAYNELIADSAGSCADAFNGQNERIIQCGESGSTLRFIIPLCLVTGQRFTLCGTSRLFSRSLSVYETLCKKYGFVFEQSDQSVTVCGRLKPDTFHVQADISSQFISGLMFVLPLLAKDSTIMTEGKIESLPYIKLTQSALKTFSVTTDIFDGSIYIPGSQQYRAVNYTVEGDWSNAAFFYALNTVGHEIEVTGVDTNSLQGDRVCLEHFSLITKSAPVIDVSDCPDLAPVLMASMAANNGGVLTGTRRLKIKESDRGAAMADELSKMGVKVSVHENSITVGCGLKKPTQPLTGHNDHRIVMALSVLCTVTGGTIVGAQAVNKSMPDFFERLEGLGAQIRRLED